MTNFTRGPWAQEMLGKQIAILANNSRVICKLQKHHGEEPLTPVDMFQGSAEDRANAALIASAPELLSALKWFVEIAHDPEICPEYDEKTVNRALERARATIKKAEGKS